MNAPHRHPYLHEDLFFQYLDTQSNVFYEELKACICSLSESKAFLQSQQDILDEKFKQGKPVLDLIKARAYLVDVFLRELWFSKNWDGSQTISVVAVGGYGRGELHPQSDIDLLFLTGTSPNQSNKKLLEEYVTSLWDYGFDIGHSVRTVKDCVDLAKQDLTVMTNLIESRPLWGDASLHSRVIEKISTDHMWPSEKFFSAKWQEQRNRHRAVSEADYNLEPNIKTSPGGLRDIQTIIWISTRHTGTGDISALARRNILTDIEAESFEEGLQYLSRVRYALHMISGRHEDRLLFEYQVKVAGLFGYADDNANLAVEKLMHEYFRRVLLLAELNDVLMQFFDETIVKRGEVSEALTLNERFIVCDGYIDVVNENVFIKDLSALLEIFVLMAEHPQILGVRASTIRLIRTYRENIDEDFRQSPKSIALFMRLLKSGKDVPQQLKRMRQYGVLSKYLPAFSHIIGQMQYDLFHIYTVDIHTLEVVHNIHRFAFQGSEYDYILSAKIVNGHLKIEWLYLAALFHDIAKGRGGDHSELGADDAREFCRRHNIREVDTNLIVWLVENHLLMSSYSQKQDLTEPDVISAFAKMVGDRTRLDYLFVLTVADIKGTNPELWNAWRASLLRQLHSETTRVLRRGLENPFDRGQIIEARQNSVIELLGEEGIPEQAIREQWQLRIDEYFLRESVKDLCLHAKSIYEHGDSEKPLIIIRPSAEFGEGITQITIYSKLIENRFAFITLALEQLDLTIHDARLLIAGGGYVLDTFYVLDANNELIENDSARMDAIDQKLMQVMESPDDRWLSAERKVTRRQKSFKWPSQAVFSNDYAPGFSVLEVISPDRPGLLTIVGKVFFQHKLRLHSAKISTLGERVEDVFFLTDRQDQIISNPETIEKLQADLREALDQNTLQAS